MFVVRSGSALLDFGLGCDVVFGFGFGLNVTWRVLSDSLCRPSPCRRQSFLCGRTVPVVGCGSVRLLLERHSTQCCAKQRQKQTLRKQAQNNTRVCDGWTHDFGCNPFCQTTFTRYFPAMSQRRPGLPRSLDFAASGISTSLRTGADAHSRGLTPPLSPAVMRAAAKSKQRVATGLTPRAGSTATAPIVPISPKVLEAAEKSNQRRLEYKASKEDLKILTALHEGPDGESASESTDDGFVYSIDFMKDIRRNMGSRSSRMRQKYSIQDVPAFDPEHQGSEHAPANTAGSAWRGSRGEGGSRWGHVRYSAQSREQAAPVEREVVDGDIDQSVPRQQGVIVFMPNTKYGFIRPDRSPPAQGYGGQGKQGDYFFHATEIKGSIPRVGDVVTFQIARPSWSNRILAVRVEIISSGSSLPPNGRRGAPSAHRGASSAQKKPSSAWRSNGGGGGGSSGSNSRWGSTSTGRWRSSASSTGSRDSRDSTPSRSSNGFRRATPTTGRVAAGPNGVFSDRRLTPSRGSDGNATIGSSSGPNSGFAARRQAVAGNQSTAASSGSPGERRLSPNRRSLNTKAAVGRTASGPRGFGRARTVQE